ncbi:MAG: CoxG family protein [Gemmobacter sp.]
METSGTIEIRAAPEAVSRSLRDPAVLRAVLPACRSVVPLGPDRFEAVFARAIGPTQVRLTTQLTVASGPAGTETVTFQGRSLVTGSVKAVCTMAMAPAGRGSRVDYAMTVELGGLLRRAASAAAPDAIHGATRRILARLGKTIA